MNQTCAVSHFLGKVKSSKSTNFCHKVLSAVCYRVFHGIVKEVNCENK